MTGDCEDCGEDAGRGECYCEDDGDAPDAGAERFSEWVFPGRNWASRRSAPARPRTTHRRLSGIGNRGTLARCKQSKTSSDPRRDS